MEGRNENRRDEGGVKTTCEEIPRSA